MSTSSPWPVKKLSLLALIISLGLTGCELGGSLNKAIKDGTVGSGSATSAGSGKGSDAATGDDSGTAADLSGAVSFTKESGTPTLPTYASQYAIEASGFTTLVGVSSEVTKDEIEHPDCDSDGDGTTCTGTDGSVTATLCEAAIGGFCTAATAGVTSDMGAGLTPLASMSITVCVSGAPKVYSLPASGKVGTVKLDAFSAIAGGKSSVTFDSVKLHSLSGDDIVVSGTMTDVSLVTAGACLR